MATPLTPNQHQLLQTLKDALNGDGSALELVFANDGGGGQINVGTVGVDFHTWTGPSVFASIGTWETIDSYSLNLEADDYLMLSEVQGFSNKKGAKIGFRIVVGGNTVWETGAHSEKDFDTHTRTPVRDLGQLSGNTTFELQARRDGGGGAATVTVEHWSVSISKED